jgi:hypothetical protein
MYTKVKQINTWIVVMAARFLTSEKEPTNNERENARSTLRLEMSA